MLLFVAALRLDGTVPADRDDPAGLAALFTLGQGTADQRWARTSLDVGPDSDDAGVAARQTLPRALYHAWLLQVPLFIDG